MKFSYVMLPDYPLEESMRPLGWPTSWVSTLATPPTRHGTRTCGCSSRPRPGTRPTSASDQACLAWSCVSPRSSPRRRRPSTSSPTVAPKWCSDQATSACWRSTTSTGNRPSRCPGQERPSHPDTARRRRHYVRRRLLQVPRAVHLCAAGPGAVAGQDRVHAGPEVVRGRW